MEESEIAQGLKICVECIKKYNSWRDRCLTDPKYYASIDALWADCHKRLRKVLQDHRDMFAEVECDLGIGLTEVEKSPLFLCDFNFECYLEWANVLYTQAMGFQRRGLIDKATKGATFAKRIMQCALEELDEDGPVYDGIVKGNLGLCHLLLARLVDSQQAKEEAYLLAEYFFRSSQTENEDSLYNLAALYALQGRTAECEAFLRICLKANNLTTKELLGDQDFAALHSEKWFEQLVRDVKEHEEQQRKLYLEKKRKRRLSGGSRGDY